MAVFAAMTAPISQATTSVDFAAPLATASVGAVLELRADSSTASTTTTSAVEALTTTFTPPVSCASELLTLLTAKSYQIWINEPAPVPGTLLTDCYPSEWVDHYTSVLSSSSSVVPVMSKLVCPSGWTTQSESTWSSGYMACCASYVVTSYLPIIDQSDDLTKALLQWIHPRTTVLRSRLGPTCIRRYMLQQLCTQPRGNGDRVQRHRIIDDVGMDCDYHARTGLCAPH